MPAHTLLPQVLWAQRKDSIFITIDVHDPQDLKIDLEEQSLMFHAKSGENVYEFSLSFSDKIDKEKSKWSSNRLVHILLVKQEPKRWAKLGSDKAKSHWLKCDWDKWLDTDDEDEMSHKGPGGDMDWSSMMGNMGGNMDFGSLGANGLGEDDDDLSDNEDDEELDGVDEPLNLEEDAKSDTEEMKVTEEVKDSAEVKDTEEQ